MHMSQYKNSTEYTIYYSDTDSIYISKELGKRHIGNELGEFKLEYVFNDAIFLAPTLPL